MQSQNEQQLYNERRKKQMYLKEEILDKGFDPNKFSEFLCNIKPEGNNIDVWAYDELINAVKSFKKVEESLADQSLDETTMSFLQHLEKDESRLSTTSKSNLDTSTISKKSEPIKADPKLDRSVTQKPQKANQSMVSNSSISRAGTLNTSTVNNSTVNNSAVNSSVLGPSTSTVTASTIPVIRLESSNPLKADIQNKHHPSTRDKTLMGIDLSEYVEKVATKKAEVTPLFETEKVTIAVTDPEQIKGGVFSSAFIQYTIKTTPLGWNVKRRYNDFYWLRETLQRLHPGVFIPPIPNKKNKNKFQEETVKKRMYFFEIFLNACLEHADLKADKYFYHFLYTLDDNYWKKIKEDADKLLRPTKLEELYSAAGQAKLDVNPDLTKYIALVEHFAKETTPTYKKIRKITKEMITHLKALSNFTIELSDCFSYLQTHTTSFNKNVGPAYTLRFGSLYTQLTKMMVSWGEQLQKQSNMVYKNFFCFYKYAAYENGVYAEMSSLKAQLEEEYQKQSREIIAKKEKLFDIGDMRQWDVDIPKARLIPKEEIFKKKELAFPVMLKTESAEVKIQRDMVAYLNQSVAAEMSRGLEQRCYLYNTNFQEFIDKQNESLEKMTTRWEELFESPSEPRTRSIARAHLMDKSIKEVAQEVNKKKK